MGRRWNIKNGETEIEFSDLDVDFLDVNVTLSDRHDIVDMYLHKENLISLHEHIEYLLEKLK